jgi:hypothetical protein
MDVPEQDVITRDNVSVKVNAVLYFRVLHPDKAVIQEENLSFDERVRRSVVATPLGHSDRAITASTRTCCSSIVRVRSSRPALPPGGARPSTGGRLPHRVDPSVDRRLRRRFPAFHPRNR